VSTTSNGWRRANGLVDRQSPTLVAISTQTDPKAIHPSDFDGCAESRAGTASLPGSGFGFRIIHFEGRGDSPKGSISDGRVGVRTVGLARTTRGSVTHLQYRCRCGRPNVTVAGRR